MSRTIPVQVTVDTDELRKYAGKHADAGHHGVAHVLYKAAEGIESVTEQHDRELREQIAHQILTLIPSNCACTTQTCTRCDDIREAAAIARGEQP